MDVPTGASEREPENVEKRNVIRLDPNPSLAAQLVVCGEIILAIMADEFNAFRAHLPRIDINDVISKIQRKVAAFNFRQFVDDCLRYLSKKDAIIGYSRPPIQAHSSSDTAFGGTFTGCTLSDTDRMLRSSNLPKGVVRRTYDFTDRKPEVDDDRFTSTNFDSLSEIPSERDSGMNSQKVAALEMEIDMLKRQLQMVVNFMGNSNPEISKLFTETSEQGSRPTTALSGIVSKDSNQSLKPSVGKPAAVSCCPPPPPPLPPSGLFVKPPPAPPLPPPDFLKSNKKTQHQNDEKENLVSSGDAAIPKPNLTNILQGINSVTLKKVPKSPGGTPCQTKSNPSANNFLKMMLDKKFKNTRLNDSRESSDWDDD
uniref:WH2 domain-containing protein n=1 Tax=Panagrolaimus sp. JU765 TaxID=591449 RepID=A0AC34R7R0_9BILA